MTLGAGFDGYASEAATSGFGSGFDSPASGIPTAAIGASFDAYASGVGSSLGVGFDETAEGYPATALGPGWDEEASLLSSTPLRPITLPTGASYGEEFDDLLDIATISDIRRETAGPAALWDDDVVETVQVGGGTLNTAIAIGKTGELVRISGEIEVADAVISRTAGIMDLQSDLDLGLRARGTTTNFNEVGHLVFETPFFSSAALSVVAAINEALEKSAPTAAGDLLNSAGLGLVLGDVVAINGAGAVGLANASADNDAAKAIGAAAESIPNTSSGKIATGGELAFRFAAGEGSGSHAKKPIFLSTTSGLATLTAPVASGQMVVLLGFVTDSSAYSTGVGGTMLVQAVQAQRRVLP